MKQPLSRTARDFLAASERRRRRGIRRRNGIIAVLAGLTLITSVTSGVALQQRATAIQQRQVAAAQALLARAGELRTSQIGQSLLLGIAAMKVSPGEQARSALISALIGSHSPTTLPGDGTQAQAVAFTPASHRLFTASQQAGYLWDVSRRAHPRRLATYPIAASAWSAAFSPDGRVLATAGANTRTLLWDMAGPGRPLAELPGDGTWVTSVAFSPDGHRLLTGTWDNSGQGRDAALLWDVSVPAAPRPIATLRISGSGPVRGVAFSHDGRIGYTANDDGTVAIWNVTGRAELPAPIGVLAAHDNTVYAVAVSPDGRTLLTGSADQTAALWDLADPARPVRLSTMAGHRGGVRAVAFSPDGATVATGSLDGTAILWRVTDRSRPVRLDTLAGDSQGLWGLAFSPDGQTVATSSTDGSVITWDVSDHAQPVLLSKLTAHVGSSPALAYRPDGHVLASGGSDQKAILWDVTDPRAPRRLSTLSAQHGAIFTLAFRPDGKALATASSDGTVMLWNVTAPASPAALARIPAGTGIRAVGFTRDGRTLAVGNDDGQVSLWNVTSPSGPQWLSTLTGPPYPVRMVAFTPDGRTLAAGSTYPADPSVLTWDVTSLQHPRELAGFTDHNSVYSGEFGPDGHTLALAEEGRKTSLWDLSNPAAPRKLATMLGQASSVYTAGFSPDGRLLADGGFAKTVIIWDISDPRLPAELVEFSGFPQPIGTAVFSPDGRTLAISGGNTPTLWDISDLHHIVVQPVQAACAIVGHGLSPAQWHAVSVPSPYQPTC